MNLQLSEKDERHSKIIRIVPLKWSYLKIAISVFVILGLICALCFLVNVKISMVILTIIFFMVLELLLSHNVIKLQLFY